MREYGQIRREAEYYKVVYSYTSKFCPDGKSLLDVGGGTLYGCTYLEQYISFKKKVSLELRMKNFCENEPLRVVDTIIVDFLKWKLDSFYDVVLCLQVLEHTKDPLKFVEKLLKCGKVVIISVPYMWPPTKSHKWNFVSEKTLFEWFSKDPIESTITNYGSHPRNRRLVAVYEGVE